MTQPQTWTGVILPATAIVVTVVMGLVNRAQTRRGPTRSVRWTVDHTEKSRYQLSNTGTADAFMVKVEFEGGSRTDGEEQFDRFAPGQRASYLITQNFGADDPRMRDLLRVVEHARAPRVRGSYPAQLWWPTSTGP